MWWLCRNIMNKIFCFFATVLVGILACTYNYCHSRLLELNTTILFLRMTDVRQKVMSKRHLLTKMYSNLFSCIIIPACEV